MPFITTSVGGDGSGLPGPQGDPGADALWNYVGEYNGGASYAVGDVVTYDGQLWYRFNANGGNVGDTPSPGLWNLLAAKGADGSGGIVYLGNYISGNGYVADLAVVRGSDNNLYIAKSSGGLGDPVGNTAEWDIFSENTTGGGGSADIADFVFTNVDAYNSSMTITGDKEMTIESGADSDLNVRAGDQVWITAGNDVILQADDTVQVRSLDGVEILSNYVDMGDAEHRWQFTQGAELILPGGGVIINAPESSSDGGFLSTLSIVPDASNETNQYVVLDPTGPNHIHIRAGGPIDESSAELILGGERNNVIVSDSYKSVGITTAAIIQNVFVNAHEANSEDLIVPETSDILIGDNIIIAGIGHPVTYFSPDPNNTGFSIVRATGVGFVAGESYTFVREEPYENVWQFGSDGTFQGPAMGGVKVLGLLNAGNNDLGLYANDADIVLQANSGAVNIVAPEVNFTSNAVPSSVNINTYSGAVINSSRTSTYAPEDKVVATLGDIGVETEFIVAGGTTGDQPEFDGAPLFTGSYIRNAGGLVHFRIDVNMDNITDFGMGQYYVDLPFPAKYNYHFRDACLHDNSGTARQYALSGHVYATQSRVTLWFTATSGQDEAFDHNSPALLTVADNFHIAGTYIMQDLP